MIALICQQHAGVASGQHHQLGENDMMKNYRKKQLQPMRPYKPGESLTGVSVNPGDVPAVGGMIAVNPNDPNDQWYVSEAFFKENYELAE